MGNPKRDIFIHREISCKMSNNDRITQPQQAIMTDAQMDEVMRVADSKTRPQQYDGYGNEHSYEYEQAGPSRRHEDEISPAPAAGIMTDAQLAEVMAHADQKRGQNTPPLAPPPQRNDAITPIPSQENVNLIRPEDGPVPGPPPAYTFAQDQNPNPVPPVVELIQRKNDIRSPKGTPLTWWEWVQIVARTCTALATLVIVGFVAHQLKREGMIYQPHGTPAYFAVVSFTRLLKSEWNEDADEVNRPS